MRVRNSCFINLFFRLENYSFISKIQQTFPSVFSPCCPALLSVLGNGLVLLISYRHRKRMVAWEVLWFSLALVDLFCCILFYPLSISSSFHHTWLGGSISCTYYAFGRYVSSLGSALTITAISGLRYLKICHGLVYGEVANGRRYVTAGPGSSRALSPICGCSRYRRWTGGWMWPTRTLCSDIYKNDQCSSTCGCSGVSKCKSVFTAAWIRGANLRSACCLIWLVATVWASLPLLGWGEYVPEPYGLSCSMSWSGYHTKDAFYIVCSFSLFTLIPFLLTVVFQCRIMSSVSRLSNQVSVGDIRRKLKQREHRLSWVNIFSNFHLISRYAPKYFDVCLICPV